MTTVAQALREAAARLAETSDTARLDAELLMAHALGVSRSDMLLRHVRDPAPEGFAALVERRADHEPLAYIVGEQEFFGRSFRVGPEVLIPRGDSESVVVAAHGVSPRTQVRLHGLPVVAERAEGAAAGDDDAAHQAIPPLTEITWRVT